MSIGLFTSRVILQLLGVSDYGIYNVVGGFVAMLAYINSIFVSATQRFLSFSLGKYDKEIVSKVFSTAVNVHCILGAIILLLAETIGLWFVNNYLNIAEDRMFAANCVYQCAIISLFFNILNVPYNASIVANERMDFYAYTSIFESLARLGAVYLMVLLPFDKLIMNAVLWALITMIILSGCIFYCKRNFQECSYHTVWDKSLLKEMSTYAGWTAVGGLGFSFKEQSFNIMLNIFFGTSINAARGIAIQVSGVVNQFASNFFMAVQPQITKQYASGQLERSRKLVYSCAKFAFCLLALVTIPIILNLEYLLGLWLEEIPEYTYEFLVIILTSTLFGSFAAPITTAIQATGNIRNFQVGVALIFLIELPIGYLLLKYGCSPYIAAIPAIFTQITAVFYRFFILKRQVNGYSLAYYGLNIVARTIAVVMTSFIIIASIHSWFEQSFSLLIFSTLLSIIITSGLIYTFAINKDEKLLANALIIKMWQRVTHRMKSY